MSCGDGKKTIPRDEWERRLEKTKIRKADLNKLVMNYLVVEGFKDAAETFARESNTNPGTNLDAIGDRMAIRRSLQDGRVDEAIERVNDLDPEILDTNPRLFFHLQQQRLIELIREDRIEEALTFAQEELARRGEEDARFLEELERTMALMAFDAKSIATWDGNTDNLLGTSQRQKIASELNAAILSEQCQDKDPRLPSLLKMLLWVQEQLDEKARYPRVNDLARATLEATHPH